MFLIRRYQYLKMFLQILLMSNVFLIAIGFVAAAQYFGQHDVSAGPMALIGFLTLFVGIVLPGWLIYRLERSMQKMKNRMEQKISELIAVGLEHFRAPTDDKVYRDPFFWSHLGLSLFEKFGKDIDHPMVQILLEMSPMIRNEIAGRFKEPSSKKKSA